MTLMETQEADEYVKKLQLAGFDEWYLPTRDEYLFLSELLLMKKGDYPIKKAQKDTVSATVKRVNQVFGMTIRSAVAMSFVG